MSKKVEIKYTCDDFLIAFKPHELPTVPLKNQDIESALSQVAEICPEVLSVYGKNEWEGSTLHRLDTATEGLVIFARNKDYYDYLTEIQNNDLLVKTYTAICIGNVPARKEICTYFRSFGPKGALVKAEENISKSDNQRLYTTIIENCISRSNLMEIHCKITRGFRHQIRVHLSYIGCPIVGDKLYNQNIKDSSQEPLRLSCIGVEFPLKNGELFKFEV